MRMQYIAAGLAGMLFVSSIGTSGFCLWYVWSSRQNLQVQVDVMRINAGAAAVRSVLLESAEYSKHSPAMASLLQSWNVPPRNPSNQPAGAAPGVHPSSR